MIHNLKQHIEEVGMCFFNLIQQQHAMWVLVDTIRQQTALVIADISGGRSQQTRDRMALHIFGHVKAQQFDAHGRSKLSGNFRFADAGRPGKQIAANRLFGLAQAGAR